MYASNLIETFFFIKRKLWNKIIFKILHLPSSHQQKYNMFSIPTTVMLNLSSGSVVRAKVWIYHWTSPLESPCELIFFQEAGQERDYRKKHKLLWER